MSCLMKVIDAKYGDEVHLPDHIEELVFRGAVQFLTSAADSLDFYMGPEERDCIRQPFERRCPTCLAKTILHKAMYEVRSEVKR